MNVLVENTIHMLLIFRMCLKCMQRGDYHDLYLKANVLLPIRI